MTTVAAGIAPEDLQKLAEKGPEKGIAALFERILGSAPGEMDTLLRTLDLSRFREAAPADAEAAAPAAPTGAPDGAGLLAANLEVLRSVTGLGSLVESLARNRRQKLEKTWKAATPEQGRQAFGEVEDLCRALCALHRHDALSMYERGEDTLLPDDATGAQLYDAVGIIFGPKPEKGILSAAVQNDAPLRNELALRTLVLFCAAQFVLEGGKVFLESINDRRKHNLLERQYQILERIEDIASIRLSRGEMGAFDAAWEAAAQPMAETWRIPLRKERVVAYMKFLGLRHNTGIGGRLPPEHLRACHLCGVSHRWVGVRCRACNYLLCRSCAPKGAGSLCAACAPAAAAAEAAAGSAVDTGETVSPTTAAETRLPNTEEETVSSYKEALRRIFKNKVASVDHGVGVITCCGRELRLQKFSLLDGTLGFVECPGCHKAHYTK